MTGSTSPTSQVMSPSSSYSTANTSPSSDHVFLKDNNNKEEQGTSRKIDAQYQENKLIVTINDQDNGQDIAKIIPVSGSSYASKDMEDLKYNNNNIQNIHNNADNNIINNADNTNNNSSSTCGSIMSESSDLAATSAQNEDNNNINNRHYSAASRVTFLKRELSKTNTQNVSTFSSFKTANQIIQSIKHYHNDENILGKSCDCDSPPETLPPNLSNHHSRIQTPASTLPPSLSSSVEIGTHLPFTKLTNINNINNNDNNNNNSNHTNTSLEEQHIMSGSTSPDLICSPTKSNELSPTFRKLQLDYKPAAPMIKIAPEPAVEEKPKLAPLSVKPVPKLENFPYVGLNKDAFYTEEEYKLIRQQLKLEKINRLKAVEQQEHRPEPPMTLRMPPKQINEPRTPLYVPAVLRPNGSFCSEEVVSYFPSEESKQKCTVSNINVQPSRSHWKPDSTRSNCKICKLKFSIFDRRHHCRKCGEVFCGKDSNFTVRLDQAAQFIQNGIVSRACLVCANDFLKFCIALEHSEQPVVDSGLFAPDPNTDTASSSFHGKKDSISVHSNAYAWSSF